jgi:hypothetical protein
VTVPFALAEFIAGRLPAEGFGHRAHVHAGFALLQRHDFADAARVYCSAIRSMASVAGHPEKFHMTITIAMLSAIGERMSEICPDFGAFEEQNPELFSRDFLFRHYSKERLRCERARRTFLLPDVAPI